MKDLVINKLELLLEDLRISIENEKKAGRSYFNNELFAIRIAEILKMLKDDNNESV